MVLIDTLFWGWYQILDKTIYFSRVKDQGIGPKEHSFFITFLLFGINVWTGFRYIFFEYFGKNLNLYGGLTIALVVFSLGYFRFLKNHRANKVITSNMNILKASLSLLLTIAFSVLTVYLMFKIGDHIHNKFAQSTAG